MTRNALDLRIGHLFKSILRYAVMVILSPLFLLFALSYKFLHPHRADDCRTIMRDYQSLAGLRGGMARNGMFGENHLPKAV